MHKIYFYHQTYYESVINKADTMHWKDRWEKRSSNACCRANIFNSFFLHKLMIMIWIWIWSKVTSLSVYCLWQKYLNYLLEIRGPSTQLMLNVTQKMTEQGFLIHLIQFSNAADKAENYIQYNLKWIFNGQRSIASIVNCDSV